MNFPHDEFNVLSDFLGYEPTMEDQLTTAQPTATGAPAAAAASAVTAAASAKAKKGLTELPPDFTPTNYSVILGRGKGSYNYVGNKRCRVIVRSFLGEFNKCDSRQERSVYVDKVLEIINEACPVGGFIKNEKGSWYTVDEKIAREKIFTMFRDCQNSESRRSSISSIRSSPRSSASSPPKLSSAQDTDINQPLMMGNVFSVDVPETNQSAPLANVVSVQQQQVPSENSNQLPSAFGPFEPVATNDDEDSLGESLGSNCGSFYDIDSCSLCTI